MRFLFRNSDGKSRCSSLSVKTYASWFHQFHQFHLYCVVKKIREEKTCFDLFAATEIPSEFLLVSSPPLWWKIPSGCLNPCGAWKRYPSRGIWSSFRMDDFTLWLCHNSYWKWPIYSGFTHWKWWFSIVMLVYQRVDPKNGQFCGFISAIGGDHEIIWNLTIPNIPTSTNREWMRNGPNIFQAGPE